MLVVVVLERLGEPHRGKVRFDERPVVAAAAEPVEAEDHSHGVAPGDLLDGAREIPRGRLDAVRPAAGEDPHAVRASRREVRSDDVVVQEPADLVPLFLQVAEETFSAEQALLFPRDRREEERRAKLPRREQPRALDRHGHAGRVVVGSGRVRLRVHHGGGHRVVMAGDQEHSLREFRVGARQEREDVLEARGHVARARRGRLEPIDDDLEPPAARFRDLLQPRDEAIPPAADPALAVVPRGERVARAARDEPFDRLAKRAFVDLASRDRA